MTSFPGLGRSHRLCPRSIGFLTLIVLLAAPMAGAQSTGGRIRGTISDPSGALVAGATVTLISEATGAKRDVQSGTSGEYIFIEVPVGSYELDVTQGGSRNTCERESRLT
ncbi:MAG TPA: carboxypeptidase-like regulatory domain-containing protein [Candidatus Acidoferrum sp.]|nr:carboxypeptidase-like regulatory domain-containing protein [Candidatus Acidoferrum sp.]